MSQEFRKYFNVHIIHEVSGKNGKYSSSLVRDMIANGKMMEAKEVLGYFYEVEGRVVKGEQLGNKLGFPTANINFLNTIIPADGIYAGLKSPGKDKLDLGIVYSERECEWAATYTKNLVLSSSVEYCKNVRSKIQGVIVNSGSANCCVGIQGLTDAQKIADMV